MFPMEETPGPNQDPVNHGIDLPSPSNPSSSFNLERMFGLGSGVAVPRREILRGAIIDILRPALSQFDLRCLVDPLLGLALIRASFPDEYCGAPRPPVTNTIFSQLLNLKVKTSGSPASEVIEREQDSLLFNYALECNALKNGTSFDPDSQNLPRYLISKSYIFDEMFELVQRASAAIVSSTALDRVLINEYLSEIILDPHSARFVKMVGLEPEINIRQRGHDGAYIELRSGAIAGKLEPDPVILLINPGLYGLSFISNFLGFRSGSLFIVEEDPDIRRLFYSLTLKRPDLSISLIAPDRIDYDRFSVVIAPNVQDVGFRSPEHLSRLLIQGAHPPVYLVSYFMGVRNSASLNKPPLVQLEGWLELYSSARYQFGVNKRMLSYEPMMVMPLADRVRVTAEQRREMLASVSLPHAIRSSEVGIFSRIMGE